MPATSQTTEPPRHAKAPAAPVFTGQQAALIALYTALGFVVLAGALFADRTRAHFIWVILAGLGWIHGGVIAFGAWLYRRLDLDQREAGILTAVTKVGERMDGQAEDIATLHEQLTRLIGETMAVRVAFESGASVTRIAGQRHRASVQAPTADR